jgi:putative ABC transport system permease protein
MITINGESVTTRAYPEPEGSGMANREANLTWRAELSPTNTLVAGEWWPPDYAAEPQVSVEADAAREMGLVLGDELRFLVAGQEVSARVSSFREVSWDSFQPNFFMVLSPGSLDDFPATYVTSLRITDDQKDVLLQTVRAHPSVSIIDIDAVLQQIRSILDKASLAVQTVFAFTLVAGIVVLFAAVQSTIDERRYESALLRALGVRRRIVMLGVLTEFAALGLAAGILAAFGASVLAYIVSTRMFELDYQFSPLLWLVGLVGGIAVVCASGFVAARGAINAPPIDVLRAN